jgi:predicted nuclease of predicted toxin-antitoxin system
VRFVLDQDVDASLVAVLVQHGHQAWTVGSAGMPDATDDDISVYAAKMDAVVVTHELDALVAAVAPFDDVFVYLSKSELGVHLKWS